MLFPRPFKNWSTYPNHVGIDYGEPDDTMVKASGDGIVTFSGWFSDAAGYGVTVDHGNGVEQKYKHSDKEDWRAPVNTRVAKGTNIMEIGKTGQGSTGYHLHHEVFVNGIIQKGDNYWKYVDKSPNGYIGAEQSSNSNSKPLNPKDEDEMCNAKPRQIHYVKDGKVTRALIVPGTEYFMPWTEKDATYANAIAANMETGNSTELTESMFNAFKQAADRCANKDNLTVTIAEA